MLSLEIVREIDRLLREGRLSQRKIAARLNTSRGIIGAIARGKRGLHGRETIGSDGDPLGTAVLPERCPCCGGRVYMPCRLCHIRALQQDLARRQRDERRRGCRRVA